MFYNEGLVTQEFFDAPHPILSWVGQLIGQYPFETNTLGLGEMELNRKGGKNQRPKIRPSKAKEPLPVPRPAVPIPPRGSGR